MARHKPAVGEITIDKRWLEGGNVTLKTVTISDRAQIAEICDVLEVGEEVVYHVQRPDTPTYTVMELGVGGRKVRETRIIGGELILRGDAWYIPSTPRLRAVLDKVLRRASETKLHLATKMRELRATH
jgi:hypothetical protein